MTRAAVYQALDLHVRPGVRLPAAQEAHTHTHTHTPVPSDLAIELPKATHLDEKLAMLP